MKGGLMTSTRKQAINGFRRLWLVLLGLHFAFCFGLIQGFSPGEPSGLIMSYRSLADNAPEKWGDRWEWEDRLWKGYM